MLHSEPNQRSNAVVSIARTSGPEAPLEGAVSTSVIAANVTPTGVVLSGAGGEFEGSPEVQRMLVYTSDGLYVSPGHECDLCVLEYVDRLSRLGIRFKKYPASIELITSAYVAHKRTDSGRQATSNGANSNEQRRIVSLMLDGVKADASDVHFLIERSKCDVKFRTLGELGITHGLTRDDGMRLVSAMYNSMCDVAAQTFNPNASQRARMSSQFTEALGLYGARVQTRPTHDGLIVVLRLLKSDDRIMTLEELGFLKPQIALMEEIATTSHGVALISGPTGSGKSRTLQATMAMVLTIEENKIHLLTVEDPPEYPIPGATITPLIVADRNDEAAVSSAWQKSVSESVRLDPDVILIGEISDLGSAKTALSAAKTGHGVWSTIHANDATCIPRRLIDMNVGADDVLDSSLLIGLTAQRLLPTLCSHCKIPYSLGKNRIRASTNERLIAVTPPDLLARVFVRGDGCLHCGNRGIAGRRPVVEVVKTSHDFMEHYASSEKNPQLNARRFWVNEMQGITMLRHALHLVWQGVVDPMAAEAVEKLDNDFRLLGVDYAKQSQLV